MEDDADRPKQERKSRGALSSPVHSVQIVGADVDPSKQVLWDEQDTSTPPAYESIFGQFREAREASGSALSFLSVALSTFAGTVGCTLSLMLLVALPMSMVVVGVKYREDCPIEPFIPIYLIVGGTFGIIKTVLVILQRIIVNGEIFGEEDRSLDEPSIVWTFFDGILNLFLFVWFIAGNIWVYSKYKPPFSPPPHQPLNYCNGTLYLFAFWVITASYMLMALLCFCICCLGLCASCTAYFVTNAG